MAFGFYSNLDHAGINWDYSGKSSQASSSVLPLSAITAVWRFYNTQYGWSYSTNDIGRGDQSLELGRPVFYVHPNQAAGTVPFYRYRNSNMGYFYSMTSNCCAASGWVPDGIAFYVYPNAATPGTVPLHLFHDIHFRYFMTLDYNEGVSKGLTYDGIWAYVAPENPLAPAAPSYARYQGVGVVWRDNSGTEIGFKIESMDPSVGIWTEIGTVSANTTYFKVSNTTKRYRVRAYNAVGDSAYSNEACYSCNYPDGGVPPPNTPPEININNPLDGDTVGTDFTVAANAFDADGAGTIAKVEFFADGNKLGELSSPPYSFVWPNAGRGNHVLTAKATDTAGAATTSSAINITVSANERTNVALSSNGGVATASSAYTGNGANFANNGERKGAANSYWNDAAPANTFPDWLQVDFNGSQTIDEIDVFTEQDNWQNPSEPTEAMTFSLYGLTGYDVQYWNGSAWVTVSGGSVTGNNKIWKKLTFPAVTTTKIRVLTNSSADGYSRLTEVEAWTARTNVALSSNAAVASASSSYPSTPSEDDSPATTNNGDRTGKIGSIPSVWNDAAPANTFPDWLQVDFNGSKMIDEIDVFTIQDNWQNPSEPTEAMTFSTYGLISFEVQYWDGSAWLTVPNGSVTGNNKVWRKFTFSAITTSKIRVLTSASGDGYSRVVELEAWTAAGSGSSTAPTGW